jgi:hypothetical protein
MRIKAGCSDVTKQNCFAASFGAVMVDPKVWRSEDVPKMAIEGR